MKTNELRIGNYVFSEKKTVRVLAVSTNKVTVSVNEGNSKNKSMLDIGDIEPIPLTEKWLLDFDFEVNDIHGYYFCFHRLFNFKLEKCPSADSHHFHILASKLYVRYVHELQNLFFALTDKELKIINKWKKH